ncbi:TadE/TadG family type IV pilus assembly protein [Rhodalgimonas zhirmunskyi]|uniref:Flp pilus assembly protein TadG n=1 Tax=Rhodalgimonas zhirmunskyi TaxID=2964767 RepID=A0AAJ1U3Y8_9RHOB|nr:hypothetical protein [Rhodoalgimonas zhirmunskyi]MDQ2093271.1 hypothetical protein [Rhodoalgimonas zhirmunskyi]
MAFPLLTPLLRRLRAFHSETAGTVAVEAVIIFPVVIWAYLGLFVYFDGYRQASVTHKASNTLTDMLSRETANITPTYVDNAKALFDAMALQAQDTKIRISVVRWKDSEGAFSVDWSDTAGSALLQPLTTEDVEFWDDKLPSVPDQERVIVVETWATYNPRFKIGMDPIEMKSFIFSRLRFAPQLRYSAN